tara:strand:+ start:3919 stop:4071 length:153 start_codon:yes stop_codon:yes gene_type:complete
MLIVIGGGVFLGIKLDEVYPNSFHFFTLLFSFFSIIISIYYTYKQASKNE